LVLSSSIAFGIALAASFALTWPVRRFALYAGFVDNPGARKVHLKPMPLLGGVAIYAGFVIAVAITVPAGMRTEVVGIVAGATLLAITGVLDDSGKLHHQIKLFVGMPLAACILVIVGIRAQIFSQILGGRVGASLDIFLTILWVVGITAAFSILDHMDGLCAGVAAIAAAFFTLSAALNGQRLVCTLAASALGAALGFLRWNFAPAKIFMGDGGAMFLGFLMATLGLKLRPATTHPVVDWLTPVLILAVPIFDTTLISISRSRRGMLPFTSPGKDHTAHRLSNKGLGHKRAVLAMYGLGIVCGTLGLAVPHLTYVGISIVFVVLLIAGACAVVALERSPYEDQRKFLSSTPAKEQLSSMH
jgi:UDP-GlcNAc:undecaprenyl-phosphate/decaprenyl-phosphate GlcNAc-1-phosphate transferase